MSNDPRQLTFRCDESHRLVQVGPDPEQGGRVTLRWHRKERGGYRTYRHSWPEPPGHEGEDDVVAVSCRCCRMTVPVRRAGDAYDRGLRGWHSIDLLRAGVSG